jgi:hypothetical protein
MIVLFHIYGNYANFCVLSYAVAQLLKLALSNRPNLIGTPICTPTKRNGSSFSHHYVLLSIPDDGQSLEIL